MAEEYDAYNGLSQKELYYSRKKYKEEVFTNSGVQRPIDFLYENPNYGFRNDHNETVFLFVDNQRASVKSVNNGEIEGVSFFVDAFEAFKEKFLDFMETNNLKMPEELNELNPVSGFSDPVAKYAEYRRSIISYITDEYTENHKIHNFDDFVVCMDQFIRESVDSFPITLSGFIDSANCGILSTGLAIELSNISASDDSNKNSLLRNRCFQCYCDYASEFGILVDKNAPWRLVADIESPAMREYIVKYGTDSLSNRQILDTRFYAKPHYDDLRDLQDLYLEAYQKFIIDKPFAIEYNKFDRKYIERKSIIWFEEQKYDDKFWFSLLLKVRLLESGQSCENEYLEEKVADLMHIRKNHGLNSAIAKIGNLIANTREKRNPINSYMPTKLKDYL